MNYSVVVAFEKSGGIGIDGKIPWDYPEDMSHFKEVTKGGTVIMGRKTWESIPGKYKPLPGRRNIVVSTKMTPGSVEGVDICRSFKEAKELASTTPKSVFVIGGKRLYEESFKDPKCTKVFSTRIDHSYKCDTFLDFEHLYENFYITKSEDIKTKSGDPVSFKEYTRSDKSLLNSREEYQYLNLIEKILKSGEEKPDRTGTGTISIFGEKISFSLENYTLPILTTKKVPFRIVLEELLWFISADTNAKTLQDKGIRIWDGNSSREYLDSIGLKDRQVGDLGPVYGFQWRHYSAEYKDCNTDYSGKGIDQLSWVINEIKNNPKSRRLFMTSWNPKDLGIMAIPPCHLSLQFNVGFSQGKPMFLDSCLYQRSGDVGLGVPFNITSYSILTMMVAKLTGLHPRRFTHFIGDAHIYKDHIEPLKVQLEREPFEFPKLSIAEKNYKNIDSFTFSDFELVGYKSHANIKMKMSV